MNRRRSSAWPRGWARLALVLALLGPAAAAAQEPPPPAASTTLRFITLAPEGSSWMKLLLQWAGQVQRRTGGRVRLRFQTATEADDERDLVRAMDLGRFQGALMTGLGVSFVQPEVRVLELPFLIKTDGEMDYVRKRLRPLFRQRLEERGYVLLSYADHGWVYGFGKSPLRTRDDFRRGRFFVWTDDPLGRASLEIFGCTIVPLGFRDVLPALTTGRIDWVYGTPLDILVVGWNRRLRYMNDFPFCPGTGALVLQKPALDKLTPGDRDVLVQTALGFEAKLVRLVRTDNAAAMIELRKQGIEVVKTNVVLKNELEPLAQAVWNKLAGSLISRATIEQVQQALADYRRGKR
jgi:TRAP-type C4-dicarboxylate transport system substrate-binding protein